MTSSETRGSSKHTSGAPLPLDGWVSALGRQTRPTLALALPVALAELGWMAMSTVDTLMVGRLGAEAIGAVGVGGIVFWVVLVFAMGILLGLDTLVSQAFGAGRKDECRSLLIHGVVLGLVIALPLMFLVRQGGLLLRGGVHPEVLPLAELYLSAVSWSLLPMVLFQAARRYLLATGRALPIMVALAMANAVNILANWALVYGNLGAPPLGVEGAGWAACITRTAMAVMLLVYVARVEGSALMGQLRAGFTPGLERMRKLVSLGLPAAMQLTLEVGVIATMTTLAGRLDPASLAAHQIALTTASLSFMATLGVAAAGAVRVGQALGRRDPIAAAEAGWGAFVLGAIVMGFAGLLFLTLPGAIIAAFTPDEGTILTGVSLLLIAAAFQQFDGVQAVAIGVLRGAGDTRTAMLWTLAAHWLLGLPVGAFLCFGVGLGVQGLWIGLALALATIACVLLGTWLRKVRSFVHARDVVVLSGAG